MGNVRGFRQVACAVHDRACGPMTLHEARVAAVAMANGACGDYLVPDPIRHLNALTVCLLDEPMPEATVDEPQPVSAKPGLQGDNYPLNYYPDGYPKLPACLDRRSVVLAEAA